MIQTEGNLLVGRYYCRDSLAEEDKNDDQEINVLKWWHVNKSGFPVAESTWDRMWLYIRQVHPEGEQVEKMIRGQFQQKVL